MQIDKEINSPHLSLALNLCVITGKAMSFMLNLSEKKDMKNSTHQLCFSEFKIGLYVYI